jgi:hypothetical protein
LQFFSIVRVLFCQWEVFLDFGEGIARDEVFSLTSQIRRSSRSVGANLAEAWVKRCYENILSANYRTLTANSTKHNIGLALRWTANISSPRKPHCSFHDTKKLDDCLAE